MSMALASQIPQIKRVAVIDDKPEARDTMAESVTDAQLQPIVFGKEQIGSLADLISRLLKESDAAIFDYHLSPGNYANFSGAEAVSELYAKKFPAILVTAWSNADIDSIRPYRRHIPVLIRSGEADESAIADGIHYCMQEFANAYSRERKPWRSLLRIEEVSPDNGLVFAVIPAWNPHDIVRFPLSIFPTDLRKVVKPDARFFADVNIGAKNIQDLYFEHFEIAEKPQGDYAKLMRT